MLCTNVLDCSDDVTSSEKRSNGMSGKELRIAQRIVLELYCQYEQSLPFREVVSSEVNNKKAQFFLDVGTLLINQDNLNDRFCHHRLLIIIGLSRSQLR